MLERCTCAMATSHSADGWQDVSICTSPDMPSATVHAFFPLPDARLCDPCIYARSEGRGLFLHHRLPFQLQMLKERIRGNRLTRPVGRSVADKVKRIYEDIEYQGQSWESHAG